MKTKAALAFVGKFRGVFPAVPTPFTPSHKVDTAAIARIVNHLIRGGVHGLWVMGSGAGFAGLTRAQRRQALAAVVKVNRHRLPILAGVSDTALDQAIVNAREAAALGADAVFAIAPYYYTLDTTDIRAFFEELASASPLPLVIYHNPFNSKIQLGLDTISALSRHKNIVGIKDSSCSIGFHLELLARFGKRKDFNVFQGDDGAMAAATWHGAAGLVAATPVFAPALAVRLYEGAKAGDIATVRSLQRKCTDLLGVFTVRPGVSDSHFLAGQQAALAVLGLCHNVPVRPVRTYTASELRQVRDILARNGVLSVRS
jgi:4-hydroxy-tetrahydrodipicolinate synthase